MTLSHPPALRSSPTSAFVMWRGAGVSRLTDIVIDTPFLSMVSVCCQTLTVRYDPAALGSNLLFVGSSVVSRLFNFNVSCSLFTMTGSFFQFRCLSYAFVGIVLLWPLSCGWSTVNFFSQNKHFRRKVVLQYAW